MRKEGALNRGTTRLCSHHGLIQYILILYWHTVEKFLTIVDIMVIKGVFLILMKTAGDIGST